MTNNLRNPSSITMSEDTENRAPLVNRRPARGSDSDALSSLNAHLCLEGEPRYPNVTHSENRNRSSSSDAGVSEIHILSDSSAIDLCDSDFSDIEVVGIDGPPTPAHIRQNSRDASLDDPWWPRDIVFDFSWQNSGQPSSARPGFDFIQHIQERIRTQAMLIERLRVFSVDVRPPVPPSIIIQSLPVRRVKDMAEALSLGSCPICLEPYRPRMTVRVLPACGHSVHKPCMDKWITKGCKFSCPLDNQPIEPPPSAQTVIRSVAPISEPSQPLRRSSRMSRRSLSRNDDDATPS